jgi:hypothetical protein
LDQVIEGSGSDNQTKVIMEALMISGGVPRDQIAHNLFALGKMLLMYFKAPKVVLQNKSKITMLLISLGSIVWPTTPIW